MGLPYDALAPGQPLDIAFAAIPDPYDRRAYETGAQALAESDFFSERILIDGEYESYAAFGDVTWDITDTISLSGGLRWTRDEKDSHAM